MVYRKLGREADAEAMLQKASSSIGDNTAYDVATINAQRGDIPRALQWLETAMRRRDSELSALRVEPDFDPLRKEPRFQVIEQQLKFPNFRQSDSDAIPSVQKVADGQKTVAGALYVRCSPA
jgi:hypothetical protein